MCTPVLADVDQYGVAVLTCTPTLGEHSDECLAFNESRLHDPVCIEADCTQHERTGKRDASDCELARMRSAERLRRLKPLATWRRKKP